MPDEHRCGDGTCILMEYLCDNRPDCRDMSDEINCGECLQLDWLTCSNTQLVARLLHDEVCDGGSTSPVCALVKSNQTFRFRYKTSRTSGLHHSSHYDHHHHHHQQEGAAAPQPAWTLQGGSSHVSKW